MSSDAKWTVGTGITIAALVVTLAAMFHARIDGLDERLREIENVSARYDERLKSLERRIGGENQP